MHETDPLKSASWKSILFCFVLFIDRLPQDISWEQVCFAAPQALWYGVAFGTSFTVVVTGNVHQAAALLVDSG